MTPEKIDTPKASEVFEASNPASIALATMRKEQYEFANGESTCVVCGAGFPYRWAKGLPYEVPTRCVTCHDRAVDALCRAEEQKRENEAREIRRTRSVPAEYAHNDISLFPADVWAKVFAWPSWPARRGLGLVGETGRCKTRMMFQRLMDLRENRALRFYATTSFRLQQAIQHQWADPECKELIKKARNSPILFLDDFGKQKFTESAENELFDIIEDRLSNHRPICFTTNLIGDELKRVMSRDVAEPLLRRLRQFCDIHVIQ